MASFAYPNTPMKKQESLISINAQPQLYAYKSSMSYKLPDAGGRAQRTSGNVIAVPEVRGAAVGHRSKRAASDCQSGVYAYVHLEESRRVVEAI